MQFKEKNVLRMCCETEWSLLLSQRMWKLIAKCASTQRRLGRRPWSPDRSVALSVAR